MYHLSLGFAQTSKKNRNHTSGCSKRFLSRHNYTDDDLNSYSDDDVDVYDEADEELPARQHARVALLADYIKPASDNLSKPKLR